jgi:two-component system NtrC family sensor kinase
MTGVKQETLIEIPASSQPQADEGQAALGWRWPRLRLPKLVNLQTRLTAPYVLLTILLAMIGTYVITQLVTSTLSERFDNQLYEASRVAADGVVQRERIHLNQLRLMVFTSGIPNAVAASDAAAIKELLWPQVLNNKVEVVTVVDAAGKEILTIAKNPDSGQYLTAQGADFSQYALIANVLRGQSDQLGDKFIELLQTTYGPFLFTSAPILDDSGRVVGAMMAGTNLKTLLNDIKAQSLADVAVLTSDGKLLETTLSEPAEGFKTIELSSGEVASVSPSMLRNLVLYDRNFKASYAPLVVRQKTAGILAVFLPSDYVFNTGAASRNWFIVIFALGTAAMIGLGIFLARTISHPILKLRNVSQAVAAGDLEQRVGLDRPDELGDLAGAFDVMTFKLRERTAEAARLYAESLRRNRELADANAKLQAAQQQLIQSEKLAAIGQLTAGIVHDVKNPLAVIVGMADELRTDANVDPQLLQECLATMRDSAWRASTIVSDLLKFARQSTPEMKRQDLGATLSTAVRLTEYLARKSRVTMTKDIPAQPVMVTYDATQIEQVLINLIQNAIQAMPRGGQLRLNLSRTKESAGGGAVAIAVQDTGIGIPAKNLLKIFDPFFTTKPPGEGTGLGLSVSYGIVARHGGRIDVSSVEGKGTTFTILLPIEPPAPSGEKESQP